EAYRADLIVAGCVLVELKSVESLQPVHHKQVLTYLKLSGLSVGLLINFSSVLLKDGLVRLVHRADDLRVSEPPREIIQ
ncbi:MAG: GxxExxY protein, partial [Planctomycetota bacterium]